MHRGILIGALLLFGVSVCSSQSTSVLENNPPLDWYQINTPHFKVLFPDGFNEQAKRMANTMEALHAAEARTLGATPRKISVVLQNQSSVSNGFVSITPRRSEFFAMPSQNYNFLGTNDWLDLLATHEYRHIVQFQHANRGFNRLLYYFFGANTLAAMSYIAVPQWFWEGDAVATETAFTSSGRGRIPNFDLLFRTNLQEGRTFNYNKQYLRSYKHNIPDHYVLGFHMTSYLRKKTGDGEVWGEITKKAWSAPFIPFRFSSAIKKESGLYVTGLYREMVKELQEDWQANLDTLQLNSFTKIHTRTSKAYTDYRFPQALDDGSVLALKSGIGDIEELVLFSEGAEKKIFTPGIINTSGMLSASQGRVVWNEYRYDPRWRVKNYSVIVGLDLATRTRHVITRQTRYAAAAISPDGAQVATIETDTAYHTRLVLLDYLSGKVNMVFNNPEGNFISMPRWNEEATAIYALLTNRSGRALAKFDVQTRHMKTITAFSDENIGHPVPAGKYVLYNSPISGVDNLYALDTTTLHRYQLTVSKYGAYNPSVSKDGSVLYYNEQGRDGMDVVSISWDTTTWKRVPELREQPGTFFQHLVEQEGRPDILDSIPSVDYEVRKYSKLKNIVNPYSWGLYLNDDLTQADIGISSRDVLNTTSLSAGYLYDINERTGAWNAGVSYQGFLPIIDVRVSKATRSVNEGNVPTEEWIISEQQDTTIVRTIKNVTFNWKEENVEVGLRIPLITTSSKYLSSINFGNYIGYTRVSDFGNSETSERYFPAITTVTQNGNEITRSVLRIYPFFNYVGNGNLVYNHFNFSFYRLLKQSRRDINSKWGQAAFLNLYNTPYGGDLEGGLFAFTGYLYFPGLAKHHSLWGYWSYQNTLVDTEFPGALNDYLFRNRVPLPRGQSINRFKEFYSMSANYTLPVWYPDVALGPLVNFQRVRANLFLDYGYGQFRLYRGDNQSYLSAGAEVKFDINVLRLLPQFDIGFRYTYGISPSVTNFEFLLGTINF